ncbi:MAG TPA: Cthe_2314 family HEPN domain-containing protein [Nitrosomonas europaea]|uniref:Cthe_2314 family HEPN domain-containing protein n=1 Tax=Nitrosomonas europaea TaxID=915 RepID=UPI0024925265|nr:Cthe_2314 family HEPN domain-containing protein [Nitrosomonas europaea]HRN82313.1 Cthe_2314 family HEPN domain-containing protein [Nitrosomonas europaea]HRO56460.1 Cthe_2314 family HEPN domain-containing protein [Nitrosomonas europaea]HRQ08922.1 Cthe_2314 family HEPN domain-containing protein [Nitrosomonas europaea]HUM74762.1 Cthe_2314 family HEPN domain-containing protein [Nitrosomonas europaea]
MVNRPAFIEHPALSRFIPHLQSYALKGLQELNSKGGPFNITEKELYAANVFERIGELDNSVKSLRLAMSFVFNLKNTHEDAPDVYRYHYENFLLRLTGIVDRAHQLVGISLLLDPVKLRKIGANEFIVKSVASDYPELEKCLNRLKVIVAKHRILRNEIAHSKAFSTRELGLFSAIRALKIGADSEIKIDELMDAYFSKGATELGLLVSEIVREIEALLDILTPVYEPLFSEMPS